MGAPGTALLYPLLTVFLRLTSYIMFPSSAVSSSPSCHVNPTQCTSVSRPGMAAHPGPFLMWFV